MRSEPKCPRKVTSASQSLPPRWEPRSGMQSQLQLSFPALLLVVLPLLPREPWWEEYQSVPVLWESSLESSWESPLDSLLDSASLPSLERRLRYRWVLQWLERQR